MDYSYSDPPVVMFVVIPLALAAVLVYATAVAWRRSGATPEAGARTSLAVGIGAAAWLALTWAVAESGVFRKWDQTPPPFGLFVPTIVLLGGAIAFSDLGRRLALFIPLWALVAVQAFRLPLELSMHAMYERGIMPGQMSYSGRNFDIVTGSTAIVVAAMVATGRGGRRLVAAWNILGFCLLVNVVTVAVLSTPLFRHFGDEHFNIWVTYPPFVWLPAALVLAALAGHLLIFRALRLQGAARGNGEPAARL